jgi:hypothetical protein
MRKRSKYRPKPILQNPLGYVLESLTPVAKHDSFLLDLKIKNHLAMKNLTHGIATKEDMDKLINMNNVVHALLRMGFGTEFKQYMDAGREALLEVCSRGAETKTKFLCRGPEITALNELLELHDAQMDVITIKDMEKAVALVELEQRTGKMIPIKPKEKANATSKESS